MCRYQIGQLKQTEQVQLVLFLQVPKVHDRSVSGIGPLSVRRANWRIGGFRRALLPWPDRRLLSRTR